MDLVQLTSSFAEIVTDFLHYLPDSCFGALGKGQEDRSPALLIRKVFRRL
jgi:hypothetical protein